MLEFFRTHVGGFFGIAIVGLLALAFTLSFGSQSAGWGKSQSEQFAASVDGTEIPETTLKYAFNLRGGRDMDQSDTERSAMKFSVLRGLVERQLLLNAAEELGISASVDEAEDRIMKSELYLSKSLQVLAKELESNFFVNPTMMSRIMVSDGHRVRHTFMNQENEFDLEMYKKFVRYHLQLTEEAFVEEQRLEIIAQRMRQLMLNSVRVSETEIRSAYDRENDTATIDYIRIIPSYFANTLSPAKEELTQWATDHPDEIKQYYETNKFKYTNIEKMVRARHILIKAEETATDEEKVAAKQKITKLLGRARASVDFATLATENSEDEASAVKGGDLGFNPRGKMVPAFDDAMFTTEPGTITDVIETKYGFHIIKVEEVREGNITIEDATQEIAGVLYGEIEGEKLAKETSDSFLIRMQAGEEMSALIAEDDVDQSKSLLGLKVLTSQPFQKATNTIPGIGEAPELVAATFNLTAEKPHSEKVFEIRNDYYVVKLGQRNTPNDKEYSEKKEEIAMKLLSLKQGSWLRDQLISMTEQAEKSGRIAYFENSAAATTQPTVPESEKSQPTPSTKPEAEEKTPKPSGEGKTE